MGEAGGTRMTRTRATYGCCHAPVVGGVDPRHECNLGRGGGKSVDTAEASKARTTTGRAQGRVDAPRASRPAPSKPAGRAAEDAMAEQLIDAGYLSVAWLSPSTVPDASVVFVRQYAWALYQGRGFAFDFAWPATKIALEVCGGAHAAGRKKVKADVERSGLAASLGWRVVTVTPEQVKDGTALALVKRAVGGQGAGNV